MWRRSYEGCKSPPRGSGGGKAWISGRLATSRATCDLLPHRIYHQQSDLESQSHSHSNLPWRLPYAQRRTAPMAPEHTVERLLALDDPALVELMKSHLDAQEVLNAADISDWDEAPKPDQTKLVERFM